MHLGPLVYARALSTPSSTPANYHLSRATSLRNQFLHRVAPRPEFQNFSVFSLLPLSLNVLWKRFPNIPSTPPTNRASWRATMDEERKTSCEVSPSSLYQIKLLFPPFTNFQLIISALTHHKNVAWLYF